MIYIVVTGTVIPLTQTTNQILNREVGRAVRGADPVLNRIISLSNFF